MDRGEIGPPPAQGGRPRVVLLPQRTGLQDGGAGLHREGGGGVQVARPDHDQRGLGAPGEALPCGGVQEVRPLLVVRERKGRAGTLHQQVGQGEEGGPEGKREEGQGQAHAQFRLWKVRAEARAPDGRTVRHGRHRRLGPRHRGGGPRRLSPLCDLRDIVGS